MWNACPQTRARAIPAFNLHLTLVFVGACSERCLNGVSGAVAQSAARFPPFALNVDQSGWFQRPRVGWLGPERWPGVLDELVADLRDGLDQRGVDYSKGPFRPHITIARKVSRPLLPSGSRPICWLADGIAVVESVSMPAGARYQVLSHHPLQIGTQGANTV